MEQVKRFYGKVVIVTGAGSGMGRAYALDFGKEGASVVVADINKAATEKVVQEIRDSKAKGSAIGVVTDVTKSSEVEKLVAAALDAFKKINILVNNAGIAGCGKLLKNITEAEWDRILGVNLKGTFLCSKAVIEPMSKEPGGRIINVASMATRFPGYKNTDYCTSKGAIVTLTAALAAEVAEYGITVNAVSPGSIRTAMTAPFFAMPKVEEVLEKRIAFGIGRPEDLAKVVLFLASEDAHYITGETIAVDGGWGLGKSFDSQLLE